MSKLLSLLGEEQYNKLKEALGADFEDFESSFEKGDITESDVNDKVKEIEGEEEEIEGEEEVEEEIEEETEEETEVETEVDLFVDGKLNHDLIEDEQLRNYIISLEDRLQRVEWNYEYKMAITIEAMKSNMHDPNDALMYIDADNLSRDDKGNIIGVKEAFDKLRENKPHLFKSEEESNNPITTGFYPAGGPNMKPRSLREAIELEKSMASK